MTDTRQVLRARARKNDYWTTNRFGRPTAPDKPRTCQRENATGRENVSRNVIARKASRKRLSPRPEPRYAKGSKHAWQRKAAKAEALRKALGQ